MTPWIRLWAGAGLVVAVVGLAGCNKTKKDTPADGGNAPPGGPAVGVPGGPPGGGWGDQKGGPPGGFAGGPPGGFGGAGGAKSGNAVYDAHCLKCHPVGGGKAMGPSLAKVAADPAHTAEWLAEHVRNPQGHKPGSKMPAFEKKLSAEELKSVVDYMAGLK